MPGLNPSSHRDGPRTATLWCGLRGHAMCLEVSVALATSRCLLGRWLCPESLSHIRSLEWTEPSGKLLVLQSGGPRVGGRAGEDEGRSFALGTARKSRNGFRFTCIFPSTWIFLNSFSVRVKLLLLFFFHDERNKNNDTTKLLQDPEI